MQHDDNTTRRPVLAAAGGAAVAASGAARAQQPGAKGPLVWLDMDQQALDDAYDQMVYAPNREQVAKRRVANSDKARAVMHDLYGPFMRNRERMFFMGVKEAEMTKYAANAMLATKISFMNEISNLCDRMGVDVESVRQGRPPLR
jgi:hypothetical protein